MKASLGYSVLLWLLVMLFPQIFAGMFTSDAVLLDYTKTALRIYMAVMFMFGIQISCQMAFNSLGKAISSIIVAVMRKFVLLIPLIYIMPAVLPQIKPGQYTWQSLWLILLQLLLQRFCLHSSLEKH